VDDHRPSGRQHDQQGGKPGAHATPSTSQVSARASGEHC
jgi:hypothetical protein